MFEQRACQICLQTGRNAWMTTLGDIIMWTTQRERHSGSRHPVSVPSCV